MIRKNNKETLADKIANVLNSAPVTIDPEDDHIDSTRAQVVDAESFADDDEVLISKLRKQNLDLLEDLDERYAGVTSSRKEVFGSDEEYSESEESSEGEKDIEHFDAEWESEENENEDDGVKEDEDGNDSDDEEEGSVEDEEFEDQLSDKNEAEKDNFKMTTGGDLSAQIKKGMCVRNQMNMWESLLEMRIQLQKCLVTANKMPQNDAFAELKKTSGKEFSDQLVTTKNSLAKVLDKLLMLQKLALKKYPETKNLGKNEEKRINDDDEEIPSDMDDEKLAEPVEEEEDTEELPKKKRKLNDFAQEISGCHEKYKSYRNSVIQKWNDKTKIVAMKNNTSSHSVLNHIEHILSDKAKLVKRTQLKRSDYTILGQEAVENEPQTEENPDRRRLEEYNPEIFDDDDFYHQLLRELIEVKSADLTDPVQLSRQWIQLQNMRSKMKRKIDTRATKGRKIRYAVHTKLVNFMAPIDENLWTDEAKTELFSSLFGKKQRVPVM